MDKPVSKINYRHLEEEMRKFHPSFEKLSIDEIVKNPKLYELYSTALDDHFTILVRSADIKAIMEAKKYLMQKGFFVMGDRDIYGLTQIEEDYLKKGFPQKDIDSVLDKVKNYLGFDKKKEELIGKNKEGDYYFYFMPKNEKVNTWHEFKQETYLDELNLIAKKSQRSIDLIFSQLDNIIYGGLKLPGVAIEEYKEAYMEAVNVQVLKEDKREMFLACRILKQLADKEDDVFDLGLFQLLLCEEPIFAMEEIEEIYLDFPNEIDENTFLSQES